MRAVSADSKSGSGDHERGFDVLDLTDVTPAEDIARAIAAAHQRDSAESPTAQMAPVTAADLASRQRPAAAAAWNAAPLVDPGELWAGVAPADSPPRAPSPASASATSAPEPTEAPAPAPAGAPPADPERVRAVTLDWVAERASGAAGGSPGNDLGGAAAALGVRAALPAAADERDADDDGLPPATGHGSQPIVPELRSYDVDPPSRRHSVEAELAKRLRKPTMQGQPRGVPFNDRATIGLPGAEVTEALAVSTRPAARGPHVPVPGLPDDAGPLLPPPDAPLAPRPLPPVIPTARVRSHRLHHVRSASAPQRQQRPEPPATHIGLPAQAAAADAPRWYRRMLLLVLLVLLDAALIPAAGDGGLVPPWVALASPGSPTFIAATFLVLVAAAAFVPISSRARAAVGTFLGLVLTAFGLALLSGAVGADAFDGQPALAALADAGAPARWVLVLAASTLPAALFWRRHHPHGVGARILLGTALVFVAFVYFAGHIIGIGDSMPLTALTRAGRSAPFLGDRVAAWVALAPFVLAPAALVTLSELGRRGAAILGVLFWLATCLPVVALAAFVAPASAFAQTLFPLQVSAVLAASLLLLPASLGALLTATLADEPKP
jgi:hypothetical protein